MSGPRILLLGANGQLGHELAASFAGAGELVAQDRSATDLTSEEQLRAAIRTTDPDLILNAAAYTAVDRAESEPELAYAINAHAPRILAEEAAHRNILLVHYSTDYVFDGSNAGPWSEEDAPHPLNVYGASKLAGEEAIRQAGGKHLIFRTSWVYAPHGRNFLLTMLRLGQERDRLSIVNDQIGSPTTAKALAQATRSIVDGILASQFGAADQWSGLYHMSCAGQTSWHGFAEAIFARAEELALLQRAKPQVLPIPSSEYPTPAQRPHNSVLSNRKLQQAFEVRLPDWQSALQATLFSMQDKDSSTASL
ncbi:dTDP-4-dehydrorhamnose reductase [Terracidiphilus sp.]|jgi:dTDP-4-dehydrorhamnose reductase|uniref:dTDP-4-dehydrorhamnose reductase n=1 Tax=Terracidiphilus sp. TaxID=1964191 RepID=UPI003C29B7EA